MALDERERPLPEIAAEELDRIGAEPAVGDLRVHRAEIGFVVHVACAVLERWIL